MMTRFAGTLLLVGLARPALAHHSFAMFDSTKEQVLAGAVTEFQWANPHIWIEMDVTGPGGAKSHWSIEGGSITGLSRMGWSRNTIKPGDQIKVVIRPLKDGGPGGSLMGITLADGRHLGSPLIPGGPRGGPN